MHRVNGMNKKYFYIFYYNKTKEGGCVYMISFGLDENEKNELAEVEGYMACEGGSEGALG